MSVHREAIIVDPAEVLQHVVTMSHRKRLHNTRVRFVSKNQEATSSKREAGEIFSTATDRLCCIFPFQIIHWLSRRGIYILPTRWAAGCTSRVGLWSSDKHREDEVQTVCSCYSAGNVALLIPMKAAQLHRNSSTRCVHTYIKYCGVQRASKLQTSTSQSLE